MHLCHLSIDAIYDRYVRLAGRLPLRLKWGAYVLAPAGITAVVLLAGLVSVAASVAITVSIGSVTSLAPSVVVVVLVSAFVAESLGYWAKERYESLLTVTVRQLAYRRFRAVFDYSSATKSRENVLTHPAQISQFAYVVDFVISTVQILALLVTTLALYGANGVLAALLILSLVIVSVRLINRVGKLWEQYVELEGSRREWVRRIAQSLPRGKNLPNWSEALAKLHQVRSAEERLLGKRVRLQTLNGFLDRGALTTVLSIVAFVGVLVWPNTAFGIGIILAARYLYGAVQNNLVNYRVIRLAAPLMRELDTLESAASRETTDTRGTADPSAFPRVVAADSQAADDLRTFAVGAGTAYVPANPQIHPAVLSAWWDAATDNQRSRFGELTRSFALSDDAASRFWSVPETLSSGERHRAAIALVLADEPSWLVLDDSFASMDPSTRELTGSAVVHAVTSCTLLTRSDEYVPGAFRSHPGALLSEPDQPAERISDSARASSRDSTTDLPEPSAGRATLRRSLHLLFGPWTILIVVGATLLASAEVFLATATARSELFDTNIVPVAVYCVLASVVGSMAFFIPIYRSPIFRLGRLHRDLVDRIDRYARPANSGSVVGRLGEDYSDLQMSIPGALGSVFFIVVHTVLVVAGAVAGAPIYLVVVVGIIPLAVFAMRISSKRILAATSAVASERGAFLAAVGAQASLRSSPVSWSLRMAGERAYVAAETSYMDAAVRQTNAYALRTALIQTLVLLLNIPAVLIVTSGGLDNTFVLPAAVVYFAVTLAAGVQSTIETLQEAGVVGLAAERVRVLGSFEIEDSVTPVRPEILGQLERHLHSGSTIVALIGPSGSGKSLAMDALHRERVANGATLLTESDPFAIEGKERPVAELAHAAVSDPRYKLILLDESLRTLSPEQERTALLELSLVAKAEDKQLVVAMHSRSNLDVFSSVVTLDE